MDLNEVVIVSALRTPIGNFNGSLSAFSAHQLGAEVIKGLLKQIKLDPQLVNEVILGQVLTAGSGQNPARQAAISAGLPKETVAMTINKVCGSGLKAVQLAAQSIMLGENEIIIAGGQESMSQAPHALPNSRNGQKMGNWSLVDTMVTDGLWEAFNDYHMGKTAENIAEKFNISREEQDQFAADSQQKAEKAINANRFLNEIIPISIPQRKKDPIIFQKDEFPRFGTTAETLSKLRPAFAKEGSVTAGNASGINDGAAAVLLMSKKKADKLGLKPMATIKSFANAGVCPTVMGTGPIPASKKALEKANWNVNELDLIEANEAFAAQAISVNQGMGWGCEKVNVNGGAIALGHPIGASGARILVTLLHEMQKRDVKKGLATLCIGGGMGTALCVER